MNEHFRRGYISTIAYYMLEGLIILTLLLVRGTFPGWFNLMFFVVYILILFGLRKGISTEKLSVNAFKKIECIVFIVFNIIIGIVCDSAQVFVYSMFLSSVVILVYLDEYISRYYMKCTVICMVCMAAIIFTFLRQKNTVMDYSVGSMVLIATNEIAVRICNFIAYQNRKNYEQERSLDDLLKLVEVKCDDARKATRTKSKFLSNMSHEIRTPINAVLGMSEIILRESKENGIKKYAHDIKSSTESLLTIINEILDSSKIASGKLEIIPVNYEMGSLLNDLYNMVSVKAKDKGLELIFDIDSSIPSVYHGDDVRLRQVIVNLLTNAFKYTKEGKVILKITGEIENDEAILQFSVKDTGIGIKEEDIDRLFLEFERIDEEKNRFIEGTGLGMNITSSLLKLMGSSLYVESEYGVGSEFSFDIVQKVVNKEPLGDFSEKMKNVVADYKYVVSYIAPSARILVVDDNKTNRKVFCNLLKQTQINISQAGSGFECLDILEKEHFDMVFLDHMMPEMDGVETFQEIKSRKLCQNTPVIMLTANAIKGAREQYLNEGFNDFISKPIRPERLDSMILTYLPKEKVQIIEENVETSANINEEKLEDIEEFDFEYARSLLLNENLLKTSLENFYKSIEGIKKKIHDLYNKVIGEYNNDVAQKNDNVEDVSMNSNNQMLKEYRIEVHALKSTSANVGALLISKLARLLEIAAANAEIDKIEALHPILIEELDKHKKRLNDVFAYENETEIVMMEDLNEILPYLDMLKSSLDNEDYGTSDLVMGEITKYRYNEDIQKHVDELSEKVLNLDAEEAIKIIELIRNNV